MGELERACNKVLRSQLPAGLVGMIRTLLERGEHPKKVLYFCRQAGATRDTMTGLAVEAEIDAVLAEIQSRKN